ncbi:MAG: 3-deoxy-manno-octulosonate cytidylyltransferase [Candidatus Saganbacteria bacterium]|nr:3-deoxy-manno-octulosonate cytidylyltransferase [Candidatus Saganbacteria bacterium]
MENSKKAPHIIGIIPARMASTRFPGKPLAKILGVPMVGHVYFRSKMSKKLNDVYVATCDREIADYIHLIGGKVIMTSNTHERASDRAAECLQKVEAELQRKMDLVVMIQGDEPMLPPQMIDEAVKPLLEDCEILVSNLMSPLKSQEEAEDRNEIKVVVDAQGFALYFSREPIPSLKKGVNNAPMFKQVCVIPFRRDFLIKFNDLAATPLEIAESIDMLRVLEHGYKVKMVKTKFHTYSVDTSTDLKEVEEYMRTDPLSKLYL